MNKTIRTICLLLVAAAIIKVSVRAASILDEITVAPVAALKTENITGQSTFGAGLDIGYDINKFVSIHSTSLAFEDWRGGVVDETSLYAKANFVRFAKESFQLYGIGGFVRDWGDEAFATSVGLGAELKLSENLSIDADYSIRAWFSEREEDSLARVMISFSF
jgi:opacity protein-like surface antigen